MNVLVIAGEFPPVVGGVGTFAANAARALRTAGARVKTVTSVPANGHRDDDSVRLFTALNHKFLKLGSLFAGSALSVLREKPDAIVAAAWPHEGLTAYSLTRALNVPYAVIVHGTELLQARSASARHRAMTKILSSASLLIANSNFTKNLLVETGFGRSVIVINPPVGVDLVSLNEGTTLINERYQLHGKRVLLTTSRLFPRKGHIEVLRALGRLAKTYPDLVYVATGEGTYRGVLEEEAALQGLMDRVRFTGFVDAVELSRLYHRCEIYVSPGVDDGGDVEGFGISFVEAGLHGKPVIAGDIGGVADAVVHEQTGLLLKSADQGELDRALVRLLDDAELRNRIGENGRARARSAFSLERQGGILMRRLDEILRAKNHDG